MTSSPATGGVIIQEVGLNNLKLKIKCLRNVSEGSVMGLSYAGKQFDASEANINSKCTVAASNDTHFASYGQAGAHMKDYESSNGKPHKNFNTEKNAKVSSDKPEEECSQAGEEFEPPDGGWGYVVLAGAFVLSFTAGILGTCFGVLFTDFLLEAGGTLSTIAALANSYIILYEVSWVLGGILIEQWGWRSVLMGCSIIRCCGMIITAFTPSIEMLFFFAFTANRFDAAVE